MPCDLENDQLISVSVICMRQVTQTKELETVSNHSESKRISNMEQVPNYLDDEAFEAPTNGLIQPLDINALLEEEGEVVREDPLNPQPPRGTLRSPIDSML